MSESSSPQHPRTTATRGQTIAGMRSLRASQSFQFWLRFTIIPGLVFVIILIVWSIIASIAKLPFISTDYLNGLLGTIGGVMGAIFAVGGLIVALVSVLTQLSIEDRIKQSVETLLPQLEERANRQITGHILFIQASEAKDWQNTEELLNQALAQYPSLSGARSFLGIRMTDEIVTHFKSQLYRASDAQAALFTSLEQSRGYYLPQAEPPPTLKAVEWLTRALEHDDNPLGQVTASSALLYAINGNYDEMSRWVEKALATNAELGAYFQIPIHLVVLAYTCGNNHGRLVALGRKLGRSLPLSEKEILVALGNIDVRSTITQFADFYAIEQTQSAAEGLKFPVTVRIYQPNDKGDQKTSMASIYRVKHTGPQERVPAEDNLPVEELVTNLTKRFLFIVQSR